MQPNWQSLTRRFSQIWLQTRYRTRKIEESFPGSWNPLLKSCRLKILFFEIWRVRAQFSFTKMLGLCQNHIFQVKKCENSPPLKKRNTDYDAIRLWQVSIITQSDLYYNLENIQSQRFEFQQFKWNLLYVFFLRFEISVFFFFNFVVLKIWQLFSFFDHFSRIYTKKTTNFKFFKCFFNYSAKICQKQFHWFLHWQSSTRRCSLGYSQL